jgi:aryl-alcohol dehydrogenase-like predicted oxidoreductase
MLPAPSGWRRETELGISATLYGVLSRGLLGGSKPAGNDFRSRLPRFSAEHRATNEAVVASLHDLARAWGLTPGQLAIAWVRAKRPEFVPVIGARTRA